MGIVKRINNRYEQEGLSGIFTSGSDAVVRTVIPENVLTRISRPYTKKVINREKLREHADLDEYIDFSKTEEVKITSGKFVEETPTELKAHFGEYCFKKPFVCSIPDAKLFGSKAIGVDSSHNIILETSVSRTDLIRRTLTQKPTDIIFYHASKHSNKNEYNVVVPLVEYYNSYHHWVFNSLTRLEGIERYTRITGIECNILVQSDPPSWVTESLNLFGYDNSRVTEWDRRVAKVNELVIPSVRRIENTSTDAGGEDSLDRKVLSPQACEWVRKKAIKNLPTNNNTEYSEKIIISRDDVETRRIENKQEVYEYLYGLGFESYVLSDMTFEEQVRLFSQAESIVSPHGAGLTNIIFSNECSVLEIFGNNIKKPTYFMLASCLNHEYSFIIGNQSSEQGKNGSINVDLGLLKDAISNLDID